jgi:5-formyltetrahydrofolate cyclo-ligase
MDKATIRKTKLNKLNEMSQQTYNDRSAKIIKLLLDEIDPKQECIVGITLSAFPEVDTWRLIEKLWSLGIRVAAPKCDSKKRSMQFYEITSFDQLEIVYMQLHEPIPNKTNKVASENISYLIVPGVVFDLSGFRIGYGGGYYDRFLSTYDGPTISLAFDEQLVEKVPTENFDLPVQVVITDKRRVDSHEKRNENS